MDKSNFPDELDEKWFLAAGEENPSKQMKADFILAIGKVNTNPH